MSTGAATRRDRRSRRRADFLARAALAVVAYLPALASSPGRMPADTKLYLYTDPGGLLGRAASTFEPDQFAGWVPHQQITYLWPSGPWFWVFDQAGVPDWIAHRLWLGTILFAAGAGVHAFARRLGLGSGATLISALAYQCSPLVLPYVSRTSLLLLPWAGLGWIMLVTLRAVAARDAAFTFVDPDAVQPSRLGARLRPWRDPAVLALIVLTVGSANATTLLMIVPGPAIWLATRPGSDRRLVVAFAARSAVLCTGVSAAWIAMVAVQARSGAPVLAYSETLTDVSRTATGSEVLRQLGYWLFYVRDVAGPTTSASFGYLTSMRVMALSYAVPVLGLASLASVRWPHRRPIALMALVGMVLAVGVHPIDSPSPLMRLLTSDGTSAVALALRSSTRAMPLFTLAIALGLGVGVDALTRRVAVLSDHSTTRSGPMTGVGVGTALVGLLVIANLPVLWQTALVDPAIDRDDELPAAWEAGIADLRDRTKLARTLQLPGAEFGAFRWGYTVDQPLVGAAERPILTRDLLPLGSAGAMDLLYALDDRLQDGISEPASLAPVARLLGADSIWLANDLEFERFRTPLPAVVDARIAGASGTDGLGAVTRYGAAQPVVPGVEVIDERTLGEPDAATRVTPVALVEIDQPGSVIRAKSESVLLAGSGDGIVDAAAAGLLDGSELVRYSADTSDQADAIDSVARVILTDSNRDRAHQWRSSQEVTGFTERGGPEPEVLDVDAADQRLAVFDDADPETQTVAVVDGPVSARASSYGDPFAYLPEHRPTMAIDGDLSTSWIVGDHGNPIGERIELNTTVPAESVRLVQTPLVPGDRSITIVRLTTTGWSVDVQLDASSLTGTGQTVPVDGLEADGTLGIEILSVTDTIIGTIGNVRGVGFAEIDLGVGPTIEYIRPPVDLDAALNDRSARGEPLPPVDQVLTRLRTDPLDIWRSDPEPELRRQVSIFEEVVEAELEVRLDTRADDALLGRLLGDTAIASRHLTGSVAHRGQAAIDGDAATAWLTPFDDVIGSSISWSVPPQEGPAANDEDGVAAVAQSILALTPAAGDLSPITEVVVTTAGGQSITQAVVTDGATTMIELAALTAGEAVTVTITGIEPRITVDRRFGDRRTVPSGIAELALVGRPAIRSSLGPDSADAFGTECRDDLLQIDGEGVGIRFAETASEGESAADTLLSGAPLRATTCTPFDVAGSRSVRLASVGRATSGLTVDRVVIRQGAQVTPGTSAPQIDVRVVRSGARSRTVEVAPCPQACWLVLGEGYNTAWSATLAGDDLGQPLQVDGGFNGWRLAPSSTSRMIELGWNAQLPVSIGAALAALTALLCLAVVGMTRGGRGPSTVAAPAVDDSAIDDDVRGTVQPLRLPHGVAGVVGAGVLIGPWWGGVALVVVAVWAALDRWAPSRRSMLLLIPPGAAGAVAALALWTLLRERPFPDAGWTSAFTHLHGLSVFSVFSLAWLSFGRLRPADHSGEREGSGTHEQAARA